MKRLVPAAALLASAAFLAAPARPQGPAEPPPVVGITAKRFEFTPKEIRLKKGEPVTLRFRSEDVTHGFMIRALKLDLDIPPGKDTDVTVTPQTAGTFTAICDHYCGSGHGGMKMKVIVE